MLNNIHCQRNTSWNSRLHYISIRTAKMPDITAIGEDVEPYELLNIAGENLN